MVEKPSRQTRDNHRGQGAKSNHLDNEKHPKRHPRLSIRRTYYGGKDEQRKRQCYHRRTYAQRHSGMLLQSELAHYRVGNKCV